MSLLENINNYGGVNMNFIDLNERQKGLYYKAGFESFICVLILIGVNLVLEVQDIFIFSGIMGNTMIGFIGVWFFNIRKTMMRCEVSESKRKEERNVMVVITIVVTILFLYSIINGSIKWFTPDGEAGMGFMLAVLTISSWIITIIKTIYKVKGCED